MPLSSGVQTPTLFEPIALMSKLLPLEGRHARPFSQSVVRPQVSPGPPSVGPEVPAPPTPPTSFVQRWLRQARPSSQSARFVQLSPSPPSTGGVGPPTSGGAPP